MQAIEIIDSLRCPGCRTPMRVLDGQDWSLTTHGAVNINCRACGRSVMGSLNLRVVADNELCILMPLPGERL